MHDLGTLRGTEGNSYAYGINDNGAIVGKSEIISGPHAGETHAFLYIGVPGEGGFMHDLGTLVEENYFDSEAHALNNLSQIVGWSMINGNPSQYNAFRLYGTMADLNTLGGGTSEAWGINDRGQIVGNAAIAGEEWICHAFLYDRGSMHDLGTLGGPWSRAFGINKNGQIVGEAQNGVNQYRAFLYNPPQGLAALNLLLLD
jgi:probable HAF family extracellular repeat protein